MIIKKADSLMTDSELTQLSSRVRIWSLNEADRLVIPELYKMFNKGGFDAIKNNLNIIPEEDLRYWTIEADEYNFIMENSVTELIVPVDTLPTYSLSDSILVHSIDLPDFDKFNINGALSKKIKQAYMPNYNIIKPSGDRYNTLSLLKNSSSYKQASPDVDKITRDIEGLISEITNPNQGGSGINSKYLDRSNIGMIYTVANEGGLTPIIIVEIRPNLLWLNQSNIKTSLEGNYSFLNNYFEPSAVTYLLGKIRKILYRKGQGKTERKNKKLNDMESSIIKTIRDSISANTELSKIMGDFYSNRGLLLLPLPLASELWEKYKEALLEYISLNKPIGNIGLKTERLIIKKLKRNFKNFMQDNSYTRPLSIKRMKEQYTSKVVSNIIREAVQSSLPGFKQGDGSQQGFKLQKSEGGLSASIVDLQSRLQSPLNYRILDGKMAFLQTGKLEIDRKQVKKFCVDIRETTSEANYQKINTPMKEVLRFFEGDDYLSLLDGIPSERLSKLTLKELLEILYDKLPPLKTLLDLSVFDNASKFIREIFPLNANNLTKYIKQLLDIDSEKTSSSNKIGVSHKDKNLTNIKPNQGHTVVISIGEWVDSSLNERDVILGFKFNEDMGKEGLVIEEVISRIVRQRGPQASFTIDMNASSDYYLEVRKVIKRIFSPELFYSPAGKTDSGQVGGELNPMQRSSQLLGNSIKDMLSYNPNIIEIVPFKYDALTNAVRGVYIFFNAQGNIRNGVTFKTEHTWFTVDSRKAGPVRTGSAITGSMCMGRFVLSKISDQYTIHESHCINFGDRVPVLEGGKSRANLDMLAPLMGALASLKGDVFSGVSDLQTEVANRLEAVHVPDLGQSSSNRFEMNVMTTNKSIINEGFALRLLGINQIPDSVQATLHINGLIRFNNKTNFAYSISLEGDGLKELIDDLDLHSFTLGQTSDTAIMLVIEGRYSYDINKEELKKFIELLNNDTEALERHSKIKQELKGSEALLSEGNWTENWDILYEHLGQMEKVELITNIRSHPDDTYAREGYIRYNNPSNGEKYQKTIAENKITNVTPTMQDSEIIIINLITQLFNIRDKKTLNLENFKEYVNKNKSEIANTIITSTTLGADYRSRGKSPGAVVRDIQERRE